MTSDSEVLGNISALVEEEHRLRSRLERGEITADAERERLGALEVELDRCWDLLRQRRALKETGQDPETAHVRPGGQVEDYLG
ncbi:MAG: DUF2630 family protein [Actinomycetia bacterium]|nr:DUF2630 family protein [Actinomycetes bacterium]